MVVNDILSLFLHFIRRQGLLGFQSSHRKRVARIRQSRVALFSTAPSESVTNFYANATPESGLAA
jgi:hypothetical protein